MRPRQRAKVKGWMEERIAGDGVWRYVIRGGFVPGTLAQEALDAHFPEARNAPRLRRELADCAVEVAEDAAIL